MKYISFHEILILDFFLGGACCEACGILVLQPGIKLGFPAVKAQNPNHWTAIEFPCPFVKLNIYKI